MTDRRTEEQPRGGEHRLYKACEGPARKGTENTTLAGECRVPVPRLPGTTDLTL